jgi:hypothetical protein
MHLAVVSSSYSQLLVRIVFSALSLALTEKRAGNMKNARSELHQAVRQEFAKLIHSACTAMKTQCWQADVEELGAAVLSACDDEFFTVTTVDGTTRKGVSEKGCELIKSMFTTVLTAHSELLKTSKHVLMPEVEDDAAGPSLADIFDTADDNKACRML